MISWLVYSADEDSHLQSLEEVFNRLEKHGFRLKLEKYDFLLKSIEYLGHVISKDGIHPVPTKVKTIVKTPIPGNMQQLKSFLDLTKQQKTK